MSEVKEKEFLMFFQDQSIVTQSSYQVDKNYNFHMIVLNLKHILFMIIQAGIMIINHNVSLNYYNFKMIHKKMIDISFCNPYFTIPLQMCSGIQQCIQL